MSYSKSESKVCAALGGDPTGRKNRKLIRGQCRLEYGSRLIQDFYSFERGEWRPLQYHLQLFRSDVGNRSARQDEWVWRSQAVSYGGLVGIRTEGHEQWLRWWIQGLAKVRLSVQSLDWCLSAEADRQQGR